MHVVLYISIRFQSCKALFETPCIITAAFISPGHITSFQAPVRFLLCWPYCAVNMQSEIKMCVGVVQILHVYTAQ